MDLVDNLLEDWCCNVVLDANFHGANCITIVLQNEILVCQNLGVDPESLRKGASSGDSLFPQLVTYTNDLWMSEPALTSWQILAKTNKAASIY